MKSILTGILAAAVLALLAATLMQGGVQESTAERHQTQGVRL